jgi:cytochrome c553
MRLLLFAALLAGCPAPTPPAAPEAAPEPAQPAEPAEPAADATSRSPADVHGHMQRHLIQIEAARQALIKGDIAASRDALAWLGQHEPPAADLPEGWGPHVVSMQASAARGASAATLADVGDAIGAAAVSCGSCHEANKVALHFPDAPMPAGDAGSAEHMRRHAWAADRMWEGLLQPSPMRWAIGARALHEGPLDELAKGQPASEALAAFSKRVHDVGIDALPEVDAAKRGALYGDFLAQCAACHQQTGEGPK